MMMFQPAYKQLNPTQRVFVDGVVRYFEEVASRRNERITLALGRPIPQEIMDRSHGMLDHALVQAAIDARVHEIAREQELSPGRILSEVMAIAFTSAGDCMSTLEDGTPVWDFSKMTPSQRKAIKKIKFEGGTAEEMLTGGRRRPPKIEVEFHSKPDMLKLLMLYTGMLQADNPHWRADMAKTTQTVLPPGATPHDAAAEYQRMIEG